MQKQAAILKFEVIEEKILRGGFKLFTIQVLINNEIFANGEGASKKKAEQEAAKNTLEMLSAGTKSISPLEIPKEIEIDNSTNTDELISPEVE